MNRIKAQWHCFGVARKPTKSHPQGPAASWLPDWLADLSPRFCPVYHGDVQESLWQDRLKPRISALRQSGAFKSSSSQPPAKNAGREKFLDYGNVPVPYGMGIIAPTMDTFLLFNCAILSKPLCLLAATRMPGQLPCPRHPLCFVGIDLHFLSRKEQGSLLETTIQLGN
ncbi:hypothetical protein MRX96_050099 [Rhipicephalus microplus]